MTFLFTDIESSTRRWEADADVMRVELAEHDEVFAVGDRGERWLVVQAHRRWSVCSIRVGAVGGAISGGCALSYQEAGQLAQQLITTARSNLATTSQS